MARTVPMTEPTVLTAGSSWQWDRSFAEFPAGEGWVLAYHLRGPGALDTEAAEIVASGDTFQVRIPASRTGIEAGTYRLAGYVSLNGERHQVHNTLVSVFPDVSGADDAGLSHAEKTLALIEAAIEGRIPADAETVQINGRAITHIPVAELVKLRGSYRSLVWRERNPGQIGPSVKVRFGQPS